MRGKPGALCNIQHLSALQCITHTCASHTHVHYRTCVCRPVELMQTEMHHVRTLKIMLCVYVRELKENLQMDAGRLDCLFPRLENLLDLHTNFLSRLKERRRESLVPPSDRNYTINKLADILIAQVWRRHACTLMPTIDFLSDRADVSWLSSSQVKSERR